MPKQSQSKQKRNNHRDAHHPSHAQRSLNAGAGSNADKENDGRRAGQQSAEEELKQLRDRTAQLEQLCRSNGLSVSTAVNGVPDRSIHRPSNIKKDTNVAEIRDHMGIGGDEHKRAWLNCRKTVRNNLTRAGFDYDVDYASQEKSKVANCLQAIEYEAPLFKRFKGSWGAEYILREVWSNRNEWLDKTKQDPPVDNSNTHNDEDDDDPQSPHAAGSRRGRECGGNGGEEDEEQRNEEQQGNGGDDGSDEEEDEQPRPRKRARPLSPSEDEDEADATAAEPAKRPRTAASTPQQRGRGGRMQH